jgi:itaconyl-CoA hydratase
MVQSWKQVGLERFRESFGRFLEDCTVGDIYEHRPGKTVTEYDNHFFTLLTLNTHPLHFDAEYGKLTEFGRNLVVSPYTLSLLIGMSVSDVSHKTIANLGMDEVKFTAPSLRRRHPLRRERGAGGQAQPVPPRTGRRHHPHNRTERGRLHLQRSMLIPARGHAVEHKPGSRY